MSLLLAITIFATGVLPTCAAATESTSLPIIKYEVDGQEYTGTPEKIGICSKVAYDHDEGGLYLLSLPYGAKVTYIGNYNNNNDTYYSTIYAAAGTGVANLTNIENYYIKNDEFRAGTSNANGLYTSSYVSCFQLDSGKEIPTDNVV